MLDNFVYENHLGQRFVGLENGVYLNYSDLRDYAWNCDTMNSRISRFYRPITSRKLPLVIVGKTGDEATAVKNKLVELAEADIEAMIPGKIFVGDYYTQGYITASVKSQYLINRRYSKIDLTFTSEDPAWYREKDYSFFPEKRESAVSGGSADYPYDYTFDYAVFNSSRTIVSDSIRANAFRMRIYGEVINPIINIGGNTYEINGSIGAGESLLIDSISKTIILTTADGRKINWFNNRSRDNYIFEPIPAGQNAVVWNGTFGFDLTTIEKRSEPKWI